MQKHTDQPKLLTVSLAFAFVFICIPTSYLLAAPPAGYTETFGDEFNTLSIEKNCTGAARWETYWCAWGVRNLRGNSDDEMKADPTYTGKGGSTLQDLGLVTHVVSGGTLKLYGYIIPTVNRDQFYNFPYVGGMISSEKSHYQTYGYWESRMRTPTLSKGFHWSMWLLAHDNVWPPEIDIFERIGNDNNFYMAEHGSSNDHLLPISGIADPNGWHTFGFLWTPTDMIWYLDGVEEKHIANYIDKPMYFLITPEIAGTWSGNPDATTIWPDDGEVDYVRVYQQSTTTPDTQAPTPPTGLTATPVSTSQINLSWASSADDVEVTGYDIYRDSTLITSSTDIFYQDTGLATNTAYTYQISARDAWGNTSASTSAVIATTLAGSATSPSPTNAATNVGTSTTLSWTSGDAATSHGIYFGTDASLGSAQYMGNQSGTTYTPGTLSALTPYYWRIDETNGSGTTTGTVWNFTTVPNPTIPVQTVPVTSVGGGGGSSHSNGISRQHYLATTDTDATDNGSVVLPTSASTPCIAQASIDSTLIALFITTGLIPPDKIPYARSVFCSSATVQASATTLIPLFTRSLKRGSQGNDVQELQVFLNTNGFKIADSGPGSSGNETTYFGPATQAALSHFQELYRDDILTPVGLTVPSGFFGPSTMKKVNAILVGA